MLRKILLYEPKRGVREFWRKLHSAELHKFYALANKIVALNKLLFSVVCSLCLKDGPFCNIHENFHKFESIIKYGVWWIVTDCRLQTPLQTHSL